MVGLIKIRLDCCYIEDTMILFNGPKLTYWSFVLQHFLRTPLSALPSEHRREGEPRIHFLLNRMPTPWNNFPKSNALAHSVNSFKSKL